MESRKRKHFVKSLKNVLKENIVKSRKPLLMRASLVLGLWEKALSEIAGEKGKGKTKAISFKDGTLKVGVYYQVWLLELRLREEELTRMLNQKLNSTIVKSIKGVNLN